MRKDVSRARRNNSSLFQNIEITVPGDFPQRQYRLRPQNLKLTPQIAPAIQNIFRQLFVSRRRTTACHSDVSAPEVQTIVPLPVSYRISIAPLVEHRPKASAKALPCT